MTKPAYWVPKTALAKLDNGATNVQCTLTVKKDSLRCVPLYQDAVTSSDLMAFADIREAIGDPEGKLMQSEMVDLVRQLVAQSAQTNAALNTCALKFREYARIHSVKPDHAKALANMEMAWLAEAAMTDKAGDRGGRGYNREALDQNSEGDTVCN